MARLFAGGWPEFIFHDQQTKRHIGRVRELFCDLELVLLDGDEIVAAGWAVPLRSGQGPGGQLLLALRNLADQPRWPRVICPVRPTLKVRYPLTPIGRYIEWTRPDGAPLDPWIRTHWRLGARVLAPAPQSQVITGTVEEWQTWTGLAFPDSGDYIIPDSLSTLHIDRDNDQGIYIEPNVWMQHQ